METPSKNIYQRINAVMQDIDYIQKGDKKVAGQYRFVSHDQVTAALHGPLTKHGIACIPTIEEMKQDGNRTEVKLLVTFVNIDNPTDTVSVSYYGYGIDTSDKGIGKAVSYAFKYALLKVFTLETGDDPDQDQETTYEPPKPKIPTLSPEEIETYLDSFADDKELFMQYVEHVMNTKKINRNDAFYKCMGADSATRNAFAIWKKKKEVK